MVYAHEEVARSGRLELPEFNSARLWLVLLAALATIAPTSSAIAQLGSVVPCGPSTMPGRSSLQRNSSIPPACPLPVVKPVAPFWR